MRESDHRVEGLVQTQGNWGEMLLERLLEHAGLQKGPHYECRRASTGKTVRVPSRLCAQAPERAANGGRLEGIAGRPTTGTKRPTAMRTKRWPDAARRLRACAHEGAVREELSEPLQVAEHDFVVMFMPIEPAFTLAATNDATLFDEALAKNVLIVTNSTLLFVVRTVAYLWTQDKQNRNAQEIASVVPSSTTKLSAFAQELTTLGKSLQSAQDHYHDAVKRLSHGRGKRNSTGRDAQRGWGVKPTKSLPSEMLDSALSDAAQGDVPGLDSTDLKVLEGMQVQMQQAPAAGRDAGGERRIEVHNRQCLVDIAQLHG